MFLENVLERPSYGYTKNGSLFIPSYRELFGEFFSRINIFHDRRNWLGFVSWMSTLILVVPLYYSLSHTFSLPLTIVGFCYSMIFLGTHGTIWFHRYSTHRAYQFSGPLPRFLVRNMAIKLIPEELYVISHHVHHHMPEKPGDPYNAHAGWWYCFLADAIHQPIRRGMSETEYERVSKIIEHTGVHGNSYAQYLKWGSICHPGFTAIHYVLNWIFWYGMFYFIGGHALATTLFGWAGVWAVGIRTFNYAGHGGGKDKRKAGIDFNEKDLSINQSWPGLITGEWHNNHHLYPNGARAGFLPYQFDPAWQFIRFLYWLGAVHSYKDYKDEFMKKYWTAYQQSLRANEVFHAYQ